MLLFSLVHDKKNRTWIQLLIINTPFYSTKSTFFNLIKV